MDIDFNDSKGYTLGIEMELQLLDVAGYELSPRSTEIIDSLDGVEDVEGLVKHELLLSNLEVISKKCSGVAEARSDLSKRLKAVCEGGASLGLGIGGGGTHPFSLWRDQIVTEDPRYERLLRNLQYVARRFNIFGLHVHVGVDGAEKSIYVMNRMLRYLPHLLALSANSPFWQGENTGLKSYRAKVFESLPIAGLPFYFSNWQDYCRLVGSYLKTGTIESIRELWWDVRPHPDFGTLEIRICDTPSTLDEALALAALIQAMVKRFSDEYSAGERFERPHPAVVRENKWRACRYGLDGEFLTESGEEVVSVRESIESILRELEPELRELGTSGFVEGIGALLSSGGGAGRQLEVYKESGDLESVARYLTETFFGNVMKNNSEGL